MPRGCTANLRRCGTCQNSIFLRAILFSKMVSVNLAVHKKSIVVKGDTLPLKDTLKGLGGRWNRSLGGWVFKASESDRVRSALVLAQVDLVDELAEGGAAFQAEPPAKRVKAERSDGTSSTSFADVFAEAASAPAPPPPQAAMALPTADAAGSGGGAAAATAVLKSNELAISDLKRATVSSFKGAMRVDLRGFYRHKESGEVRPTPKGISLSVSEWNTLKSHMDAIDRIIDAK